MKIKIEEMILPYRAYACLKRGGINYKEELYAMSDQEILKIKNINIKTLEMIKESIKAENAADQIFNIIKERSV